MSEIGFAGVAAFDGTFAPPAVHNRIWKNRTVGVGVLPPEVALEYGVTGPMLRASGVDWDLRKARP